MKYKVSEDNLKSFSKAASRYFEIFPHDQQMLVKKNVFDKKPQERSEAWQKFNLPVDEIQERFKKITQERNKLAKERGFNSYIELRLDHYSIPKLHYTKMLQDVDSYIGICNKKLANLGNLPENFFSEFNPPCYICRVRNFPFKNKEEILEYFSKKFNIDSKIKDNFQITYGEKSGLDYSEDTERFVITLQKDSNKRHQLMDLVHELSHMLVYLKFGDAKEKGLYGREKETLEIETEILKDVSQELYSALFGEFLKVYWRVFFEIELYKNPKENLSKLYAEAFNKCFPKGNQKDNHLYLLDSRITLNPLSTLPHAVAQSQLLGKMAS